jgi:hypothetical protein
MVTFNYECSTCGRKWSSTSKAATDTVMKCPSSFCPRAASGVKLTAVRGRPQEIMLSNGVRVWVEHIK